MKRNSPVAIRRITNTLDILCKLKGVKSEKHYLEVGIKNLQLIPIALYLYLLTGCSSLKRIAKIRIKIIQVDFDIV